MPYSFANRLTHSGSRMGEVNTENVTYERGATSLAIPVSPILGIAEEAMPDVAVTRVELQEFGIDVSDLDSLYPPEVGDVITRADGSEFRVTSMGSDNSHYRHTTSVRTRIIVWTDQIKEAD